MKKVALLGFLLLAPFYILAQTSAGEREWLDGFDSDFTPPAAPVATVEEKIVQKDDSPEKNFFPSYKALELTAGYNTGSAFETYRFYGNLKFILSDEKISIKAGLQYGPGNVDATSSMVFWPLRFTHVKLGFGVIYNIEFFGDISMTNNILPGIYVDYRPCSWFSLDAMTSFFVKGRTIYAFADVTPLLMNYSVALGFNMWFYLPYNFALSVGCSSYEDFRYMVLCAPTFSGSVSYTLNKSWSFSFTALAHYVDFFTLSSAYEDAEFKLSARYIF